VARVTNIYKTFSRCPIDKLRKPSKFQRL